MQCEICDAIRRLGLDPAAHDLWYCSNSHSVRSYSSGSPFRRFLVRKSVVEHEVRRLLSQASRHLPRLHLCPAYRQRIIKLGL
jgi:hypothetical protein